MDHMSNFRFMLTILFVVVFFHLNEIIQLIKTDIASAIAITITGCLFLVHVMLFSTRKDTEQTDDSDTEQTDDSDTEQTNAAKVLCQLRQVERETANRNEQRRHTYATRSSVKSD